MRSDPAPPPPLWTLVSPPGMSSAAMDVTTSGVLVGGAALSGPRQPRLEVLRGTSWTKVPISTVAGYGQQATLVHVSMDSAGRIVVIGTATGGAHLNPRWSTFVGNAAGIDEEPQTMTTFGGEDAGGITDVLAGKIPSSSAPGVCRQVGLGSRCGHTQVTHGQYWSDNPARIRPGGVIYVFGSAARS